MLAIFAVSFSSLPAQGDAWRISDAIHSDPDNEPGSSPGRRPESLLSREYASLLFDDTKSVLTSPLRWKRNDWLVAGSLAGLVVASSVSDGGIKEESQETITPKRRAFTANAQRFGAEGSWAVIGAFEVCGILANDGKAKAVAMDCVTSSIISAGIVAPLIKLTAGRVRPNASERTFQFKPFSGNYSFPSGHVTQAFSVASVIAAHYDQWWVKGLAYGVAGAVGYSRIEQNSHYASDVFAGAIIGTVIGRTIVHRHNKPKDADITMTPFFDGLSSGIMFARRF